MAYDVDIITKPQSSKVKQPRGKRVRADQVLSTLICNVRIGGWLGEQEQAGRRVGRKNNPTR